MKKLFRYASLLAAAVMLLASCGGTGSTGGNNEDNKIPDEPVNGELTLEVDKLIITSDGKDAAVLTPLFNGKAVTEGVVFYDGNNKTVDLPGGRFVIEADGTYSFWAKYKTFTSNTVSVTAVPTAVPATPADPKPASTSFVKRVLLTKITGAGCVACPAVTLALHNILDEHELAPYVVKAEAHTFESGYDPAQLTGFYSVSSWPTVIVDWAQFFVPTQGLSTQGTIEKMIEEQYAEPAKAGIALSSKLDANSIVLKVCVKAAVDGNFSVGAWLLEDGIEGTQAGAPAGEGNEFYHKFDDCIRIADSKRGAGVFSGKKLGSLKAGETAEMMFLWTNALKENWKKENLELCVFVSSEEGNMTTVTNVIKAPVNGEVKYEYAK